jgi:endonuclease/exonuclease/phosphatase family metal-dependent hydrolase
MTHSKQNWLVRIIEKFLLLANLMALGWLLLCVAAAWISPENVKYLPALSLTTPFALLVNMAMVFLWLFTRRKYLTLISLIPLILCWKMIPAIFGLHFFKKNDWQPTAHSFKIMSWNVHAMGLFNPPHEKKFAREVMNFIKKESPDILCLPEFATALDTPMSTYADVIKKENNYHVYQFDIDNGYGPYIWIGSAVFSRFPLVGYEVFVLNEYISLLQCDFTLPNDQIVRVFVLHLQSFGLSDTDKAIIESLKKNNPGKIKDSRTFAWKFNEAYRQRAREAEKAMKVIKKSPYPVIVCGDFNDLPYSYTYTVFSRTLTDAFSKMGKGLGRTYNQIVPTLRIDHIFYTPEHLNIKAFKTVYSPYSDHSPIIANFEYIAEAQD